MSKPRKDHENELRGALTEINSGTSALNMPADPIPEKEWGTINDPPFLSETDRWVKHAMEHFHCAFELLARFEQKTRGRYLNDREWSGLLAGIETLMDHAPGKAIESAMAMFPEQVKKGLEL